LTRKTESANLRATHLRCAIPDDFVDISSAQLVRPTCTTTSRDLSPPQISSTCRLVAHESEVEESARASDSCLLPRSPCTSTCLCHQREDYIEWRMAILCFYHQAGDDIEMKRTGASALLSEDGGGQLMRTSRSCLCRQHLGVDDNEPTPFVSPMGEG